MRTEGSAHGNRQQQSTLLKLEAECTISTTCLLHKQTQPCSLQQGRQVLKIILLAGTNISADGAWPSHHLRQARRARRPSGLTFHCRFFSFSMMSFISGSTSDSGAFSSLGHCTTRDHSTYHAHLLGRGFVALRVKLAFPAFWRSACWQLDGATSLYMNSFLIRYVYVSKGCRVQDALPGQAQPHLKPSGSPGHEPSLSSYRSMNRPPRLSPLTATSSHSLVNPRSLRVLDIGIRLEPSEHLASRNS